MAKGKWVSENMVGVKVRLNTGRFFRRHLVIWLNFQREDMADLPFLKRKIEVPSSISYR